MTKTHSPKPGRLAYTCQHKDHQVKPRVFLSPGEPVPRCKQHGKLERQENNTYMGQDVPEAA